MTDCFALLTRKLRVIFKTTDAVRALVQDYILHHDKWLYLVCVIDTDERETCNISYSLRFID